MYSKFSFGDVYHRIHGRKFIFKATRERSRKTHARGAVKCDLQNISDDIRPQMKILNMVIPILMHFCSFVSNWSLASRIKPHVIQRNVM